MVVKLMMMMRSKNKGCERTVRSIDSAQDGSAYHQTCQRVTHYDQTGSSF